MYEFDLQMYADATTRKAVHGKKIVYLFRPLGSTSEAVAMAFVTENERSMSKDSDSTATKDGPIVTPSEIENEITATALLANDDTLMDQLEVAMISDTLIEIWEANLDKPVSGSGNENKFDGRYMQGYLTEFTQTSSAEDYVEVSTTFAINGAGAKGSVTVSKTQQEVAAYVFADTTAKTGA